MWRGLGSLLAVVGLVAVLARVCSAPSALGSRTKTAGCVSQNGLPDLACTPGATDQRVTQANIATTICRRGYTTTIRPSLTVTDPIKKDRIAAYGLLGQSQSAVVLDHLVPLELGGAPQDMANLWPEPSNGSANAHMKDSVEHYLNSQVCSHNMQLGEAQHQIAADWLAVYKSHGLAPAQSPE